MAYHTLVDDFRLIFTESGKDGMFPFSRLGFFSAVIDPIRLVFPQPS